VKTTIAERARSQAAERRQAAARREEELAQLSAHLSAASARWLELAWELHESGDDDDPAAFLAFRYGITGREARESLRVAEALQELPATRAAFARGELTSTKVRSLTKVASASSEQGLLELAGALSASQLERALRAFRRVAAAQARDTHELEYVDYSFAEDGSLYLRARLPAEDGTLLVKALEAARERVLARRRAERSAAAGREGAGRTCPAGACAEEEGAEPSPPPVEPPRSLRVEALLELAESSLGASEDASSGRAQLAHWARGGETSLANLVLLCPHHHGLVHEGGYTVEDDPAGGLRFRNRHGVLCPSAPPRSPPGSAEALLASNERLGLGIGPRTLRHGGGDPLDLELAVSAILGVMSGSGGDPPGG